MSYYELSPSHMSPLSPSKEGAIIGARRCDGCGGFLDAFCPVDVRVQNKSSGRHGLNFLQGCSDLGVIKKRLLEALDNSVVTSFALGRVTNEEGRVLPDVVTFRIPARIIVRGEEHATVRYCPVCGAACYFAMGRPYLFPEPNRDVAVFSSGHGGLVIRGDLFVPSRFPRFPGVQIIELSVLKEPRDALGRINAARSTEMAQPTRPGNVG